MPSEIILRDITGENMPILKRYSLKIDPQRSLRIVLQRSLRIDPQRYLWTNTMAKSPIKPQPI